MTEAFTKADIAKVKKWENVLEDLQTGKQNYFAITTLLSVKSLCKNSEIRQAYSLYLFDCIKNKIVEKAEFTEDSQEMKLLNGVTRAIEKKQAGLDVRTQLFKHFQQLVDYQNHIEKHRYSDIRIITSSDLLVVEELVRSFCSYDDKSCVTALYYATRTYVEKYNPSIGTGLITNSIPFFEEVLDFWKGVALSTKLNASRK